MELNCSIKIITAIKFPPNLEEMIIVLNETNVLKQDWNLQHLKLKRHKNQ